MRDTTKNPHTWRAAWNQQQQTAKKLLRPQGVQVLKTYKENFMSLDLLLLLSTGANSHSNSGIFCEKLWNSDQFIGQLQGELRSDSSNLHGLPKKLKQLYNNVSVTPKVVFLFSSEHTEGQFCLYLMSWSFMDVIFDTTGHLIPQECSGSLITCMTYRGQKDHWLNT